MIHNSRVFCTAFLAALLWCFFVFTAQDAYAQGKVIKIEIKDGAVESAEWVDAGSQGVDEASGVRPSTPDLSQLTSTDLGQNPASDIGLAGKALAEFKAWKKQLSAAMPEEMGSIMENPATEDNLSFDEAEELRAMWKLQGRISPVGRQDLHVLQNGIGQLSANDQAELAQMKATLDAIQKAQATPGLVYPSFRDTSALTPDEIAEMQESQIGEMQTPQLARSLGASDAEELDRLQDDGEIQIETISLEPGSLKNQKSGGPQVEEVGEYLAKTSASGSDASVESADIPLFENFEGSFPSSNGWTVTYASNGYTWDDDPYKPYSGSWSGWCADGSYAGNPDLSASANNYPTNMDAWMKWGPFSLSGFSGGSFSFWRWLDTQNGADYLQWFVSTNGTNWYGMQESGYSGNAWHKKTIDFTSVPVIGDITGDASVWIAIRFISDGTSTSDKGAFVDDVKVERTGTACPDLVVSAGGFSPGTITATGQTFTVNATVKNIGNATAGSSRLDYYLSTNTIISTADYKLGEDPVGTLAQNGTSSESLTIGFPASVPNNTYYVGWIVDAAGQVTECDENNGWYLSSPQLVVNRTGQPNLIASAASFSPTFVCQGQSLTVNVTVKNDGNATAGSSRVDYYLSTNTTITTGDYYLCQDPVGTLAPNATSSESCTITFPGSIPPGTYYVGFIVDAAGQVTESDENNGFYLGSPQLTVGGPDLIVSAGGSNPGTICPGEPFSVTATVKNNGNATAGSSRLDYYLSTNTTITTGDYKLGEDPVSSLAAGATSSESLSISFPSLSTIPAGVYYVGLIVDAANQVQECNENNGWYLGGGPHVTVQACQKPDLIASNASFSPTWLCQGENLTVNVTVKNIGPVGAGASRVDYYLSSNTIISTSDHKLGQDAVSSLAPNATSNESITVPLPGSVPPGAYYVGFIVDAASQVDESDENNGFYLSAPQLTVGGPDLIVSAGSVSPTTVGAGQSFTVNGTVKNSGNALAGASRLDYYLSDNTTITTSDYKLGEDPVGGLSPGATSSESLTIPFPGSIPDGSYWVGWIVDALNQVHECDENNGWYLSSPTVTVVTPQGPDLIVQSGNFTPQAVCTGDNLTINAVVKNVGDQTAGASRLDYYLSDNTTISTSDHKLGEDAVSSLAPGATSSEQLSISFPSGIPSGSYYVAWICDAAGQVTESDENNGFYIASPKLAVCLQKPDLIVESGSFNPTSVCPGDNLTINAVVKNAGQAAAGASRLDHYLSTNMNISPTDTKLGETNVPGLAVNGTSNQTLSLAFPASVSSGSYYVGWIADATNAVDESDEANGFVLASPKLDVTNPCPADRLIAMDTQAPNGASDVCASIVLDNQSFEVGGFTFTLAFDPAYLTFTPAEAADPVGSGAVVKGADIGTFENFGATIDLAAHTVTLVATADLFPPPNPPKPIGAGEVAKICFDVVPQSPPPSSDIPTALDLTAGQISNPAGTQQLGPQLVDGVFTILACTPGDANGDGTVGIADVVYLINCLLGTGPCPGLCEGDANGDGTVGIADVVYLINCLLGTGPCPMVSPPGDQDLAKLTSVGQVSLADAVIRGGKGHITVDADLRADVAALKLSFAYDDRAMKLGRPEADNLAKGMSLASVDRDGVLDVILYDVTGRFISAESGHLLRIPVELISKGSARDVQFEIKSISAADLKGEAVRVENLSGASPFQLTSVPTTLALHQNYPNPFNPETVMNYDIPAAKEDASVVLRIYNVQGQMVRELVNAHISAGSYSVTWDGRDDSGRRLSAGVYFAKLKAGDKQVMRKLSMVK